MPFYIKDTIDNYKYINIINYCEERTRHSMAVFDSLKRQVPLDWEKSDWALHPKKYSELSDRLSWWNELTFEVSGLMRTGMLSFRIEEAVYQTCLGT